MPFRKTGSVLIKLNFAFNVFEAWPTWPGFFITFVLVIMRILIGLCFSFSISQAQMPGFEIYLTSIGGNATQGYYFTEPENISRNPGYDNQPHFNQEGSSLIFSSVRGNNQADIYQYDIVSRQTIRLTNTPESEYSPEFYADAKYISTVRVEVDSAQRLWSYKIKNRKFKPLLKNVYDVGYYCHVNSNLIALFLLPEPFKLSIANIRERIMVQMDKDIGRSIKMIPTENSMVYVVKTDSSYNVIKKYNFDTRTYSTVTKVPSQCEDIAWTRDNKMLMANGSVIYYFDYQKENKWYVFADMRPLGIKNIYRISISADGSKMAFVADE